jgi:hypothetical protein
MPEGKPPNPYVMAVATAFLTAIVTLTGSYFTSRTQMKQVVTQYQLNMRLAAYGSFLDKVDRAHSPVLSKILNIGTMDQNVATDTEIQELEDILGELIQQNAIPDLYWQLNSDLKIVRLSGSLHIQELSEDLLKVLVGRYSEIDILKYPISMQEYYREVVGSRTEVIDFGLEKRLSDSVRISIFLVGRFFDHLVNAMHEELKGIKE